MLLSRMSQLWVSIYTTYVTVTLVNCLSVRTPCVGGRKVYLEIVLLRGGEFCESCFYHKLRPRSRANEIFDGHVGA